MTFLNQFFNSNFFATADWGGFLGGKEGGRGHEVLEEGSHFCRCFMGVNESVLQEGAHTIAAIFS